MSYQVIARKWRPPTFAQVIGQEAIAQTLNNALKDNRLPHALLFTGPRGTGKTSSARILAKALRCPEKKGVDPCNKCSDCVEINESSNINVIEIDGASHNGVDSIRELRDTVGYKPTSGEYKIYIIDEVHMLSISAFNALLKTLEEPPSHVVFIMATTEAHKIPHTILSRCQRFDFRRIPTATIAQSLSDICKKEGVPAEEEALWALARQADGSMRDSQSLLDQVMTFSGLHITYEKVIQALSLTHRQLLIRSLQALVERNTSIMLEEVEKIVTSGADPKVFVQELLEEIRHLLIAKLSPEKCESLIDLPQSEIEQLKTFSQKISSEDIHLLFEMGLKGAQDIPQASDPQLVLEILMLRMASAPRVENLLQMEINPSLPSQLHKDSTPSATSQTINSQGAQAQPIHSQETHSQGAQTQPTHSQETHSQKANSQESPAPLVNWANQITTHTDSNNSTDSAGPTDSASPADSTSSPPADPLNSTTSTSSMEKKWAELVKKITKINQVMGASLNHSFLSHASEKKLVIGLPQRVDFLYDKMKKPDFQNKLKNYITTFWGSEFEIEIQMEEAQPHKISSDTATSTIPRTPKDMAKEKARVQNEALHQKIQEHPLVKSAKDVFKIKDVSLQTTKPAQSNQETQSTNTK